MSANGSAQPEPEFEPLGKPTVQEIVLPSLLLAALILLGALNT